MMTRKHFQLIADTIRCGKQVDACYTELAHMMADTLAGQNPNFDRWRFLEACGVEVAR